MPLLDIFRTKGLWIGLGAAIAAVILMCALGALLVVKGALPQQSLFGWICGSYVLAGLIGVWIAAKDGKGTLLRSLIVGILLLVVAWSLSLTVSNGMQIANGGWKIPVSVAAGCLAAGVLRAGGGKKRKRKRRKPLAEARHTTRR